MFNFFRKISDALKLTTLRDVILASTFVLGFLPILSFLFRILNVPKEEIFNFSDLINSWIIVSKKSSTIFDEKFLEKPK